MIKTHFKQTGSAHIIIVIILILAILGALGYIAWNDLQGKNQTHKSDSNKTTATVSVAPQYLDLIDWSVKLTLPTGLSMNDVVYYKTHVGDGPDYYGFTTSRVKAQGGLCVNQASGNLAILNRSSTQQTGMGSLINSNPIGGYYYYIDDTDGGISPLPNCLSTNIAVQDRALLDKLVKSPTISETVVPIKELGISITVPDSIKDLTYTYTADGTPTRVGGSNIVVGSVNFSTTSLTAKYPACSSDKANPLGGLTKITGVYTDGVLGPTWSGGGMAKQFSDSFLTFAGPQFACYFNSAGSNDMSFGESITSHMSDLSTAIKEAKEL